MTDAAAYIMHRLDGLAELTAQVKRVADLLEARASPAHEIRVHFLGVEPCGDVRPGDVLSPNGMEATCASCLGKMAAGAKP
jgi:hypothetical protein